MFDMLVRKKKENKCLEVLLKIFLVIGIAAGVCVILKIVYDKFFRNNVSFYDDDDYDFCDDDCCCGDDDCCCDDDAYEGDIVGEADTTSDGENTDDTTGI